MNIYVGNLPFSVSEQELHDLFAEFGAVSSVNIINDRDTGRSRGFGFVEMDDSGASQAIESLDGAEFGGRRLKVNQARPRQDR